MLTEEGILCWMSCGNIKPDIDQIFTIEYEAKDHFWINAWWGESAIIPPNAVREVFWDEQLQEYQ